MICPRSRCSHPIARKVGSVYIQPGARYMRFNCWSRHAFDSRIVQRVGTRFRVVSWVDSVRRVSMKKTEYFYMNADIYVGYLTDIYSTFGA